MADETGMPAKKSGAFKWILIILVLLGLLGAGGWYAYTEYFSAQPEQAALPDEETTTIGGEGPGAQGDGQMAGYKDLVSLPTFIVNLADPLGRRYLKLAIDVEVVDQQTARELADSEPKVRDAIILLLSSKTFEDLSTIENKIELKKEIVERLNQIVGAGKVLRVYFTDMVIQ